MAKPRNKRPYAVRAKARMISETTAPAYAVPIRIVLDANVLVSALFGGLPARAVARAMKEEVVVSDQVLEELHRLSQSLTKRLGPELLTSWNSHFYPLIAAMRVVSVRERLVVCRDPADDAYLSLAGAAGARFLVTGDDDLLSVGVPALQRGGLHGLSIVTPREFLAMVEKNR